MTLIIAEKPSLARNIVAGIGSMNKKNGYFENGEYIVTWAFGHLFSLCDIEDYTGPTSTGRWSLENIPCFPEKFKFSLKSGENKRPDSGVERQFNLIKSLCQREDVTEIVNAGDADREGEIIVRLCIENSNVGQKQLSRLWLPDQTPETIAQGLKEMKSESEYDNLAAEGFSRTYIDWLYGVNLTRLASLRTGTLLRVGRVIVPIVKAIYDRDLAIRNFVPEIYYALVSKAETNGEVVELKSKYEFPKEKLNTAQRACDKLNAQEACVKSKKTAKTTLKPPKLFSLSKLQNYLGKKYKMSMEDSLAIVQGLYEKGYLTYPRTNSEYLATAEKDKIKKIISGVEKLGYPVKFIDSKQIFDDSKIESHSALTPTYKLPAPNALSEDEKKVYSAVLRRFVAVFCSKECSAVKTEMVVAVGECEDYTLKGTVIIEKGWTEFDSSGVSAGKVLPDLNEGDRVNIDFHPVEKQTSPPKHYTIETLNNYLKNPFREEKAKQDDGDDSEDYKAMFEGLELGTEATRTGIIDNAIKSNYISLKKDVYTILPDGEFLIEAISQMGISMDKYKTSELGKALKSVFRGTMTTEESVNLAKNEIAEIFGNPSNNPNSENYSGLFGDSIGICPLCGGNVVKYKKSFSCSEYKNKGCQFTVWQTICQRPLSVSECRALLTDGKTDVLHGFVSKKGTAFDAALKLENGKVVFDFIKS